MIENKLTNNGLLAIAGKLMKKKKKSRNIDKQGIKVMLCLFRYLYPYVFAWLCLLNWRWWRFQNWKSTLRLRNICNEVLSRQKAFRFLGSPLGAIVCRKVLLVVNPSSRKHRSSREQSLSVCASGVHLMRPINHNDFKLSARRALLDHSHSHR